MIGIDTNVLLRILVPNDDKQQSAVIRKFMSERTSVEPAYISLVVLAEAVWVLGSVFEYSPRAICDNMGALLLSSDLIFECQEDLDDLLLGTKPLRGDITDYLIAIANRSTGCTETITFDRKAAKAVDGMELLK